MDCGDRAKARDRSGRLGRKEWQSFGSKRISVIVTEHIQMLVTELFLDDFILFKGMGSETMLVVVCHDVVTNIIIVALLVGSEMMDAMMAQRFLLAIDSND